MVVRSMIRRTTGCFYFRRRLMAMIDYVPSSSITATATVTSSSQPLNYYYCSSSKTSFPTTSMILRIPGRDNLQRQRQHRFFSTSNNNDGNGDNSGHDVKLSSSSSSSTYTQLLTEATAKQLQGDVPSAIQLTIQALELMKDDVNVHANNNVDDENEIAETILFLGKLYQLENQFEKAVKSFEKARDLFDSSSSSGGGEEEEKEQEQQQRLDNSSRMKKRYFTAITHLAYAQKELGHYDVSERHYLYSLKGLEQLGGYSDGMTNHTCYELSQLYKTQHKFRKAIDVLETMKMNLSTVFGKTDSKVLQLNSELANLLLLLETQEQSQDKQQEQEVGKPLSSSAVIVTTTTSNKAVPSSSSSSSTSSSSLKNAIDLLEEAMDNLPPNSPEGRRIFMQIDELKEQQQQQHQKEDQQHQKEEEDQQLLNNKLHPGYW